MLSYSQSSGDLTGLPFPAQGYSGHGLGKNDPEMEDVQGIGPLPRGDYHIGAPVSGTQLGPLAIPLHPLFQCERSGFFIHGDSFTHPGQASHGCIILPRNVRQAIIDSRETTLEVTI